MQATGGLDRAGIRVRHAGAMATKYLSPHHSDDDPGGLIHDALAAGDAFHGPAEDLVLTWTLRLGDDRDPAEVAQRLLAAYGIAEGPPPSGAAGRVVELLRETASYPAGRLRRHLRRKRAGRRRGKG